MKVTSVNPGPINFVHLKSGVPGGIRTHDPEIRNLVLYPAELRGLDAYSSPKA